MSTTDAIMLEDATKSYREAVVVAEWQAARAQAHAQVLTERALRLTISASEMRSALYGLEVKCAAHSPQIREGER